MDQVISFRISLYSLSFQSSLPAQQGDGKLEINYFLFNYKFQIFFFFNDGISRILTDKFCFIPFYFLSKIEGSLQIFTFVMRGGNAGGVKGLWGIR